MFPCVPCLASRALAAEGGKYQRIYRSGNDFYFPPQRTQLSVRSSAPDRDTDAKALAESVIDKAYGYQIGVVLFKPTLTTTPHTFRTTRAGALSYFVGGDSAFPDDSGFALKGWTKCEVENAALFISGNGATTMGKVHFTDPEGKVTTVDKTWGFVKDDDGTLRIVVHHSSLEYVE